MHQYLSISSGDVAGVTHAVVHVTQTLQSRSKDGDILIAQGFIDHELVELFGQLLKGQAVDLFHCFRSHLQCSGEFVDVHYSA
ncbi:hypothetical protein D3C78_1524640 [compost metagenome]